MPRVSDGIQIRMQTTPAPPVRTWLSMAWFVVAALYAAYAAYTYTGLFQVACEWQDHVFGAHDASVSFMSVLFLCALPAFVISPRLWRRNPAGAFTVQPAPSAVPDAAQSAALTHRILIGIAAASLLIALSCAALARSRDRHTPIVTSVDLLHGQAMPDLKAADQVTVDGLEHPELSVVLTQTTNGSKSSELYTPLTGPGWQSDQPLLFVTKQGLDPEAINGLGTREPVHFGPALMHRHDLPGEVRTDWQKHGLNLSPDLIVLDRQVSEASQNLWVTCFMAGLFTLVFGAIGLLGPRMAARRAASAGR